RVAKLRERIAFANRVQFGRVTQVVPFAVRTETCCTDDEETGFASLSNGAYDRVRRRQEIGRAVVQLPGTDAEGLTSCGNRTTDRLGRRRRLGDAVVFDDEEHR